MRRSVEAASDVAAILRKPYDGPTYPAYYKKNFNTATFALRKLRTDLLDDDFYKLGDSKKKMDYLFTKWPSFIKNCIRVFNSIREWAVRDDRAAAQHFSLSGLSAEEFKRAVAAVEIEITQVIGLLEYFNARYGEVSFREQLFQEIQQKMFHLLGARSSYEELVSIPEIKTYMQHYHKIFTREAEGPSRSVSPESMRDVGVPSGEKFPVVVESIAPSRILEDIDRAVALPIESIITGSALNRALEPELEVIRILKQPYNGPVKGSNFWRLHRIIHSAVNDLFIFNKEMKAAYTAARNGSDFFCCRSPSFIEDLIVILTTIKKQVIATESSIAYDLKISGMVTEENLREFKQLVDAFGWCLREVKAMLDRFFKYFSQQDFGNTWLGTIQQKIYHLLGVKDLKYIKTQENFKLYKNLVSIPEIAYDIQKYYDVLEVAFKLVAKKTVRPAAVVVAGKLDAHSPAILARTTSIKVAPVVPRVVARPKMAANVEHRDLSRHAAEQEQNKQERISQQQIILEQQKRIQQLELEIQNGEEEIKRERQEALERIRKLEREMQAEKIASERIIAQLKKHIERLNKAHGESTVQLESAMREQQRSISELQRDLAACKTAEQLHSSIIEQIKRSQQGIIQFFQEEIRAKEGDYEQLHQEVSKKIDQLNSRLAKVEEQKTQIQLNLIFIVNQYKAEIAELRVAAQHGQKEQAPGKTSKAARLEEYVQQYAKQKIALEQKSVEAKEVQKQKEQLLKEFEIDRQEYVQKITQLQQQIVRLETEKKAAEEALGKEQEARRVETAELNKQLAEKEKALISCQRQLKFCQAHFEQELEKAEERLASCEQELDEKREEYKKQSEENQLLMRKLTQQKIDDMEIIRELRKQQESLQEGFVESSKQLDTGSGGTEDGIHPIIGSSF